MSSMSRIMKEIVKMYSDDVLAYLRRIEALEARVRELEQALQWVSVKDRLPERNAYVLWNWLGEVVEGYYEPWPNGMQFWRATRSPSAPRSLTEAPYWMPFPVGLHVTDKAAQK